MGRQASHEGCAACTRESERCRSTGDYRGVELRSKGAVRAEEWEVDSSDRFFFFHQGYQSQIRTRETANSPPDSTVPAMPNYREIVSDREGDGGGGQRQANHSFGSRGLSVGKPNVHTYPLPSSSWLLYFAFLFQREACTQGKKNHPIIPNHSPGVGPRITCTGWYLPMALPTRGRVIINTTAGELDIELWSRVRNRPYHCNLLRPETRSRNVRRHAETSSRSPWRVSFRSPTSLFPLLIIPLRRHEVTMTGSYSTGRYPFPFHWKPRSGGTPLFLERPKLILFPCCETGSSKTFSFRPVIGPARGEAASPSTEACIMQFTRFLGSMLTRGLSPQNHSKTRYIHD